MSRSCCHGSFVQKYGRVSCPSWSCAEQPVQKESFSVTYSCEAVGSVSAVCTDDESPVEAGDQWTRVEDINSLKNTTVDDHLYWPLPCRRHITRKRGRAVQYPASLSACRTGKQEVLISCLKAAIAAAQGALAFSVGNPRDSLSKQKSLAQTIKLRKQGQSKKKIFKN